MDGGGFFFLLPDIGRSVSNVFGSIARTVGTFRKWRRYFPEGDFTRCVPRRPWMSSWLCGLAIVRGDNNWPLAAIVTRFSTWMTRLVRVYSSTFLGVVSSLSGVPQPTHPADDRLGNATHGTRQHGIIDCVLIVRCTGSKPKEGGGCGLPAANATKIDIALRRSNV